MAHKCLALTVPTLLSKCICGFILLNVSENFNISTVLIPLVPSGGCLSSKK